MLFVTLRGKLERISSSSSSSRSNSCTVVQENAVRSDHSAATPAAEETKDETLGSSSDNNKNNNSTTPTTQATSWKWSGMWEFGSHATVIDQHSSNPPPLTTSSASGSKKKTTTTAKKNIPLPFLYKFERAEEPSKIAVPSLEISEKKLEATLSNPIEEDDAIVTGPLPSPSSKMEKTSITESSVQTEVKAATSPKNSTTSTKENAKDNKADGGSSSVSVNSVSTGGTSSNRIISFADKLRSSDPEFTEATTQYPNHAFVPPSGLWKGYFETAVGLFKKNQPQRTTQIHEECFLFLNSTPPTLSAARQIGLDRIHSTAASVRIPFPANCVHVRGRGENQYGVFELDGSLDLMTGVLECQRMYIVRPSTTTTHTATTAASLNAGNSRRDSRLNPNNPSPSQKSTTTGLRQPYFTRKRPLSWKKKAATEAQENDSNNKSKSNHSPKVSIETTTNKLQATAPQLSPPKRVSSGRKSAKRARSASSGGDNEEGVGGSRRKRSKRARLAENVEDHNRAATNAQEGGEPTALDPVPLHPESVLSGVVQGFISPCSTCTVSEQTPLLSSPPLAMSAGDSLLSRELTPLPASSVERDSMILRKSTNQRSISDGGIMSTSSSSASSSRDVATTALRDVGTSTHLPRSVSAGSTSSITVTSSSVTSHLKLPLVGDPHEARWRAAHFLYYHSTGGADSNGDGGEGRGHPNATSPTVPSVPILPGTTTTSHSGPKYVIYEGELFNSQRNGRGMCLYSNGLLYEGDWVRDCEQGIGTLMTADRKFIIYKGEWDRGKMHGQGVYNYYSERLQQRKMKVSDDSQAKIGGSNDVVTSAILPRYEGEFKENIRHGTGSYFLTDGSTYVGSWQNNVMMGRGVFTWADGSVYDGDWKDGKRHGPGILRASDGFTYDGNWSYNSMEGRGSATYPNGQQYMGLFTAGRREGRGTLIFTNGAIYEGRFRDDALDGQGTLRLSRSLVVPRTSTDPDVDHDDQNSFALGYGDDDGDDNGKEDFMIPVSFHSDIGSVHRKAGFTLGGE